MDAIECIHYRRSIRQFTDEMPPREHILECLEAASWAPNPTSQQPWRFIVLTGQTLRNVCEVIARHFHDSSEMKSRRQHAEPGRETRRMLAEKKKQVFGDMMAYLAEQGADLKKAGEGNFNFHGAPVGIIFATYPEKDYNYFKSTVAAMQNFMLAAAERGMGTCWINAVSICDVHISRSLALPADLVLVDGIAAGYADAASPLNTIPRDRYPVEQVTKWM